jgi:hypothetical protein
MSLVPNKVHIENGASTVDLQIGGGGLNSLVSTGSLKVETQQTLTLKGYDANFNVAGNFGVGNADGSQIYRLPNPNTNFPSADQVITFNFDGTSQFSNLPVVPVPPSGSSFMFNPSNADLNMNNHAITGATDVSTANYSLETVGAQTDSNVSEISTLQGQVSTLESQVSTLESQVSSLITIIFNLTGIQV